MVQRGGLFCRGCATALWVTFFLLGNMSLLSATTNGCRDELDSTAKVEPIIPQEIQIQSPEMGFAAMNEGTHYSRPSANDEAMIQHFLSDFPEVSREALSSDLLVAQEQLGGDEMGFFLNLRSFAQRNDLVLKDVLIDFLAIKEFILEAAEELRPSEISFGPRSNPIVIKNQDILDIFDMHDGKLPVEMPQILANAIYAGAMTSKELMDTVGFMQKFSIDGIELIGSLKFLRESISITKRVEGFTRTDTEVVYPSYAEALLLYEILNSVPALNNSKKLRDKIKSLEERPHRNDELDAFDDVINLLATEYGFRLNEET